jgi:hypothetical protein
MHRARTIGAISKAADQLPLVEIALVLMHLDHAVDSRERTIWIADAHRDDGKRFVVRADEKLTAFLELERPVCIHLLSEQSQP